MSECVIQAAAYLGPEGHGNDLTGLRPWPAPLRERLRCGELEGLRWHGLFASDASRFARMDWLSRIGLMAVELLDVRFAEWPAARRDRTGVCAETCCGGINTDASFLELVRPSLFTYSLPSTVIGEVCIRHQLRGPQLCLMPPVPSSRAPVEAAIDWLREGEAEACVCLSCETVDGAAAKLLPAKPPPGGWFASALCLGRSSGAAREYPLPPGTLADICLQLCARKPDAAAPT